MSFSGAGRGRGWLRLSKSEDIPRPGGLNCDPLIMAPIFTVSSVYNELILRIKELNPMDDGIKFNQKMKLILKQWNEQCACQEDVMESFDSIYNACLNDMTLGTKLVMILTCNTFKRQRIQDVLIIGAFFKRLQRDFENSSALHLSNPEAFRHCVHLIGEYFHKSVVLNNTDSQTFTFLIDPLCSCLDLLLTSRNKKDLALLTAQFQLNGAGLESFNPEAVEKLCFKIRSYLVMDYCDLEQDVRTWLLLLLELSSSGWAPLSAKTAKFYENILGTPISTEPNMQADSNLSVQTVHSSKILDQYQSDVNVLQIAQPLQDMSILETSSQSQTSSGDSAYEHSDISTEPMYSSNDYRVKSTEKTGRPILGAGARLHRDKVTVNNNATNGGGKSIQTKEPRNNKGWEHDDRFHNDY